jgi:P22 tail accessory factor
MGWTKRQLIEQAFAEIGLANYIYDLSPEMIQKVAYRLDSMMGTWYAKGINIGYPLPATPDATDFDGESFVPAYAIEAVYLNLALRIAPGFGKQVLPSFTALAKEALDSLELRATEQPQQRQFPTGYPMGSGNKTESPFYEGSVEILDSGPDGPLEF